MTTADSDDSESTGPAAETDLRPSDARQRDARMRSRMRLLRWASLIMLVLGVGHLSLLVLITWQHIMGWVNRGIWAAVPLALNAEGDMGVASLQNKITFWAGPGSFAVPLILLGGLIWHLAGHGLVVPAGIGWGVVAWCVVGGVLLVPSPFFVGTIAGGLIVVAARRE